MSESENALLGNIKKKGENSYYYAHAPRNVDSLDGVTILEGDGIITGGHPVLIKRHDSIGDSSKISMIRNYSWADGEEKVSVYIEFEEDVDESKLQCEFQSRGFDLSYFLGEDQVRKLVIRRLYKDVDTERCSFRVRRNKITVNLWKVERTSWYKLNDN